MPRSTEHSNWCREEDQISEICSDSIGCDSSAVVYSIISNTCLAAFFAVWSREPRQKQNAISELTRLSILQVRHVKKPAGLNDTTEKSGRTVATHWRRGHFRAVPSGPKRSLRTIKWILPVMVNPDETVVPAKTQIHKLSKRNELH